MPGRGTPEYIDEVVALVAAAMEAGVPIPSIGMSRLDEISSAHGVDTMEVLADCLEAKGDLLAISEIQAGHTFHREDDDPLPPSELIGRGMISDGTLVFVVDDFIESVDSGDIRPGDGYGEFVSGSASEFLPLRCHPAWLREFRDEWPYIAWYTG